MDQQTWNSLTREQRLELVDNSDLTPQLIGLEGYRVSVLDTDGNKRRFIVGKSTGWKPCHLEIKTKRSLGGSPADKKYLSIWSIERVR